MRKLNETRNYAMLPSLIEEAQTMANRMEQGLSEKREIKDWNKEWRRKKRLIKKLKAELQNLEEQVADKNEANKQGEKK